MAVYAVTWNLNKEGKNYSNARAAFIKQLSAYEYVIDPGLETVAFISTGQDAQEISDHLSIAIDATDRMVVTQMHEDEHQGILDPDIWEWITDRL